MTISVFESLKSQIADTRGLFAAGILALAMASAAWAGDPAAPAAPAADSAKLPFKQQTDTGAGVAVRVLGGLVVVILLGYGAVYAMKRYLPSVYGHSAGGQRKINVIETRRLTQKATLFLVEVDGVRLLLAQCGDRVTNLQRMADRDGHAREDGEHGGD
jgi:flagellar biogenesis protein FliO